MSYAGIQPEGVGQRLSNPPTYFYGYLAAGNGVVGSTLEPLVWSSAFTRSGPPEGGTPNKLPDAWFMVAMRVRFRRSKLSMNFAAADVSRRILLFEKYARTNVRDYRFMVAMREIRISARLSLNLMNIQHPTSNALPNGRHWMFDVGCWM